MFKRSRRKIILSIMGSLILLFVITLSVILFASYREVRQENMDMLERYVELFYLKKDTESAEEPAGQMEPGETDEFVRETPADDTDGAVREERPEDTDETTPKKPPDAPDKPAQEDRQPPERDGPPPESTKGKPSLEKKSDYQLSTFYSVAFGKDGTVLAADNGEKEIYSEEDLTGIAEKILEGGQKSGRYGNLAYVVSHRPDYTLVAFMDNTVSESSLNTLLRNILMVGGVAIVVMFFISLLLSKRIIRPLEENDRQQRQFVSDASHELKTPVAVIGTNAEMLSMEIGENEWLANIQYENDRMGELVKQLLDLSRTENAEEPMEEVDFSRIVMGEVLAFETLAFDQGKEIRSNIDEEIHLAGSPARLTQIVSVLLDNAIRHSTGGEIEVSLTRHGHDAVLSVINEGDEIPPEKRDHLFERFYRVDEARNSDGHHYGLGLAIAKAVTEKHGGNISVSCHEGKIQFTVSLPIKK